MVYVTSEWWISRIFFFIDFMCGNTRGRCDEMGVLRLFDYSECAGREVDQALQARPTPQQETAALNRWTISTNA